MELNIINLTKYYGNHCALNDVSITLTNGIYGLLGANGAGKSTLMNLITDNINRTSGEILYDGADILKLGKAFRKKIGYMPQQQGFLQERLCCIWRHSKEFPEKNRKSKLTNCLKW